MAPPPDSICHKEIMRMKKLSFRLLLTALVVLGAWIAPSFAEETAKAMEAPKILAVGDKAAGFTLNEGLTGNPISLEKDIIGKSKLLAISFMNTACSACNAEIRLLSQMAEKYPDLNVVAMAVDSRGGAMVKTYNEANKFKVTYVLDPEYTQPPKYGFNYTPAMILLDKSGTILMVKGGFNPHKDADSLIKAVESNLK